MRNYFITACGTDIGKSFVTAALAHAAIARGINVAAFKPIISGFDAENPQGSDSAILLQAMGRKLNPENIAAISPWRYRAPLAPNMAASMENSEIDFAQLMAWNKAQLNKAELTLIEGVGGAMVPLNNQYTVRDWIAQLQIPAILVTGSYLGSISHTLTAIEALRARNISLRHVVVSESAASSVPLAETTATLRQFIAPEISLIAITRSTDYRDAAISPLLEDLLHNVFQ